MNGAMTGMEEATAVLPRRIRRAQAAAHAVLAVAVAGSALRCIVVSPTVRAALLNSASTIMVFVSVIEFFLQDALNPDALEVRAKWKRCAAPIGRTAQPQERKKK